MEDVENTDVVVQHEEHPKSEQSEQFNSVDGIYNITDELDSVKIEPEEEKNETESIIENEPDVPVDSIISENNNNNNNVNIENNIIEDKAEAPEISQVNNIEIKSVPENSPREPVQRVRRDAAAFEILHSERYFVQCLDLIMEHLLLPLRKLDNEDRPIIEKSTISLIFSNIETLAAVNKELLIRLEERMQHWATQQRLADIFITMAPYLKSYCTYCDNYDVATITVNHQMNNNLPFRTFLEKFQKSAVSKKLDAFMYLIMPVQRIPRYVLLLETLQRYTPVDDVDYADLTVAIQKVRAVADKVNKSVRNRENRAKVIEIQSRLVALGAQVLVEPQRLFVKEGMLAKLSMTDDSLQTRAVYLFSDLLLTAVPLVGGLLKVDKMIPIVTACTMDNINGPYKHMFYLVSPSKTHVFVCTTKDDKTAWVQKINEVIAELVSSNASLAAKRNEIELEMNESGVPYMKINGQRMVKQSSRLKLHNIVANSFERIKSVVTFQRPKSVSLERAERDELEDFVMIADLHKPSVKSPRSSDASERDSAPTSGPVKAQQSSAVTTDPDGGYVEHSDDKYSLASVIERTADIAPPVDGARDLHGLEESTVVEESPSENTDIPDYLWNEGTIQIASKLSGQVTECSSSELIREDPVRHKHFSVKSTYLVFGESGNKGGQIGHIALQNIGDAPIVLIAHQRKLDNPRSAIFILRGRTKIRTDYRGLWCIEVNRGDCSNLVVFDFSINRGTGKNNDLGMIHG